MPRFRLNQGAARAMQWLNAAVPRFEVKEIAMRWRLACACFAGIACFAGMACVGSVARGAEPEPLDEQAQRGGSPARNNVRNGQCLPESWDVGQFDEKTGEWLLGTGRNIRWVARLGTQTHGTPVVAEGKVFIGTNNGGGRLPRYPATVDLGCLLAFRAADGEFLWQHSSEKLPTGRVHEFARRRWSKAIGCGSSATVARCCVSIPRAFIKTFSAGRRASGSKRPTSSGGSTCANGSA